MHKELLEMHDELQAQIPPVTDSFVNYGLIQLDLAAGRHLRHWRICGNSSSCR